MMLDGFTTMLLDMNQTFMFGADRFGPEQDYSVVYRQLGGKLARAKVNFLISSAYEYLNIRYPDLQFRENFPSVAEALAAVSEDSLSQQELSLLVSTFARHEIGHVPEAYVSAIEKFAGRFRLGLVVDIWAPKELWVSLLAEVGVMAFVEAASFSSEGRAVKPSPRPFLSVLNRMNVRPEAAVMIGDSARRDLSGAKAAGVACILVGGARHPAALANVDSLLTLASSCP